MLAYLPVKNSAFLGSFLLSLGAMQPANADTPVTASVVLRDMAPKELVAYVAGIVEGLAYARFRRDTAAAGHKVEDGMNCIRNWYHGSADIILKIESAFRRYGDYPPWIVVAAMVDKECGE